MKLSCWFTSSITLTSCESMKVPRIWSHQNGSRSLIDARPMMTQHNTKQQTNGFSISHRMVCKVDGMQLMVCDVTVGWGRINKVLW